MKSKGSWLQKGFREGTGGIAARAGTALLTGFMLTYLCGCSFFAPSTQPLSVTSDPQGARVEVNGNMVGETPVQYNIQRNRTALVTIRKDGYQTVTRSTSQKLSTWGILDIVGRVIWLVPILGLIAPGAWEQEGANISVVLPKKSED